MNGRQKKCHCNLIDCNQCNYTLLLGALLITGTSHDVFLNRSSEMYQGPLFGSHIIHGMDVGNHKTWIN